MNPVGMIMANMLTEQLLSEQRRKLRGIDLEKEYALIQQKKSNLSRSMRELVVRVYERKMQQERRAEDERD